MHPACSETSNEIIAWHSQELISRDEHNKRACAVLAKYSDEDFSDWPSSPKKRYLHHQQQNELISACAFGNAFEANVSSPGSAIMKSEAPGSNHGNANRGLVSLKSGNNCASERCQVHVHVNGLSVVNDTVNATGVHTDDSHIAAASLVPEVTTTTPAAAVATGSRCFTSLGSFQDSDHVCATEAITDSTLGTQVSSDRSYETAVLSTGDITGVAKSLNSAVSQGMLTTQDTLYGSSDWNFTSVSINHQSLNQDLTCLTASALNTADSIDFLHTSVPVVRDGSYSNTVATETPLTSNFTNASVLPTCHNQGIVTSSSGLPYATCTDKYSVLDPLCHDNSNNEGLIEEPCSLPPCQFSNSGLVYDLKSSPSENTCMSSSTSEMGTEKVCFTELEIHEKESKCEKQKGIDNNDCGAISNQTGNLGVDIYTKVEQSSSPVATLDSAGNINAASTDCQVCGDTAAGFHCGAYVCEACKKFFIRTSKKASSLSCSKNKQCVVTKKLRTLCQYCRYQKCLQLGMYKPGEGPCQGGDGIAVLPCRVCSAPSSGYHFGAITCEGCKGFFRRMTKERNLNRFGCVRGGSCPITQTSRNMCKFCRYQKCFQVGMSADGSRIGRQPNAVKHATLLEMQSRRENVKNSLPSESSHTDPETGETQAEHMDISPRDNVKHDVSGNVKESSGSKYQQNSSVTKAAAPRCGAPLPKPLYQKTSDGAAVNDGLHSHSFNDLGAERSEDLDIFHQVVAAGKELSGLNMRPPGARELQLEDFQDLNCCWDSMMDRFTCCTHATLNFAKKIPGFRSLKLDDQAALLQTAAYPIVILSLSKCYNSVTQQYNYFGYSDRERGLIHQFFPGFIPLKTHFITTGDMVTMLKLNEIEYHFLSALILLSPDEGNVDEREKVWEVQENIAAALQEYEEKTYEDGGTRFGVLIARLAEFRLINLQHQQIIGTVIRLNPTFRVPQLFTEMYLSS